QQGYAADADRDVDQHQLAGDDPGHQQSDRDGNEERAKPDHGPSLGDPFASCRLPTVARGRSLSGTAATGMGHDLSRHAVLALTLAAVTPAHGRAQRGWHRWLGARSDGGETAGFCDTRLQVTELAFQVRLEPAAVLALERAQVVDPALELLAGLDQRAHGLAVALLRVPLEALGAGAGVAGDLLGLAPGLGENLVGLAASAAQG